VGLLGLLSFLLWASQESLQARDGTRDLSLGQDSFLANMQIAQAREVSDPFLASLEPLSQAISSGLSDEPYYSPDGAPAQSSVNQVSANPEVTVEGVPSPELPSSTDPGGSSTTEGTQNNNPVALTGNSGQSQNIGIEVPPIPSYEVPAPPKFEVPPVSFPAAGMATSSLPIASEQQMPPQMARILARASQKAEEDEVQGVRLNFVDTDLGVVLKTLSSFLNKTFILSPNTDTKVTIINPKTLRKEEAYEVLLGTLELSGYGVAHKGNLVRVFPKEQSMAVTNPFVTDADQGSGNELITRIIELKHMTPTEAIRILNTFANNNTASLVADQIGNKLVVQGYASHVSRFEEILSRLDIDHLKEYTPHFVFLNYSKARDVVQTIQKLYAVMGSSGGSSVPGGIPGVGASSSERIQVGSITSMFALDKENAVVFLAPAQEVERVSKYLEYLDRPLHERKTLRAYQLQEAKVDSIRSALQKLLSLSQSNSGGGIPGGSPGLSNQDGILFSSEDYLVLEDIRLNQVLVFTTDTLHERISQMLQDLDRKAFSQALVQSIPVRYTNPEELLQKLKEIFSERMGDSSSEKLKIVADTQRSLLILSCKSERTLVEVIQMIQQLDTDRSNALEREKLFLLENAKSVNVKTVLEGFFKGEGQNSQSPITVVADDSSNSLLVKGSSSNLRRIQEIIRTLDQPVGQIMVEVLILEALLDESSTLGVEWQWTEGNNTHATNFSLEKDGSGNTIFDNLQGFRQSFLDPGRYKTFLQAIKDSEKVKIIATPRLWASNNQEASFLIGDQVPIKTSESQNTVGTVNSFEYQDVGIKLNLKPRILRDGTVSMEVSQEIKTLRGTGSADTGGNPIIQTREVKTFATVANDHTVVIGGLIREDVSNTRSKVPLMGDLPFVGGLFRKKTKSAVKTEMLIFLTPTVVNPGQNDFQDKFIDQQASLLE